MSLHGSPWALTIVLVLVGTAAAVGCSKENGVLLQQSDSLSQEDKVLMLSQMFQQALFADNTSQALLKMREVFFPSSKYRYWHADNIEIIDIDVCINFNKVTGEDSRNKKGASLNSSPDSQCLVFRWTNSYFLNIVDIRQMNYFELASAGILFGSIAYHHWDREIQLAFNLTHIEFVSSIEDIVIKQALIQFLSWSKLYARSQALPSSWDETYQGFVTRKYDYTAVDLLLFDKQNYKAFLATLTCFVLSNIMVMYLIMKCMPSIYTRLSKAANQSGYSSSIAKGLLVLASILVSTYIVASVSVYSTEPALSFTRQCTDTQKDTYGCIPEDEYATVHGTQVLSLVANFSSILTAIVLYFIRLIHTVRHSGGGVFKGHYVKWIEVYLLWSAMVGIHILLGLASIPLLIFTVLTPMYMIFYLSSVIVALAVFLLPIAAVFHIIAQVKERTQTTLHTVLYIINFIFVYLVGAGIITMSIFLYYLFLAGGASMNGVKGTLYSLLPPVMISVVVFVFRQNTATNKSNTQNNEDETQPLLFKIKTITEHL